MREDSQDVGSEAAIIARVRKSSLVECAGTENVSRLKQPTEAMEARPPDLQGSGEGLFGRGAFCEQRSRTATTGGARRRENAGMSNERSVRTRPTGSLRIPGQRQSPQG